MSLFAAEPASAAAAVADGADGGTAPVRGHVERPSWPQVKAIIDAARAAGTHGTPVIDTEGEWVLIIPPPRHVGPAPRHGGPCQVCGRSAAAAECETCGRAMCAAHFERHTHTLSVLPRGWTGTTATT